MNDRIIKMCEDIHWLQRDEDNFIKEHKDINTFIIINEIPNKQIDYINISYMDTINMYDNLFTANIINEYINKDYHILQVNGTIGYSADTQEATFYYDIKLNKIYVYGNYRMMACEFEVNLFKDTFEMDYEKHWKLEYNGIHHNLKEIVNDNKYENIGENSIPYYRYPRTKDGISIPRIIYNVFKIFSNSDIPKENKPKIIIPNYFNTFSKIRKV